MRRQMTICTQVVLGFAVFTALLLGLGYMARSGITRVGRQLDTAVNVTARSTDLVGELGAEFRSMKAYATRWQLAYVLARLVKADPKVGALAECTMCHVQEGRGTAERELGALAAALSATVGKMRPLAASETDRSSLTKVEAGVRDYVSMFSEAQSLVDRNQFDEAHAVLRDRMLPLAEAVDKVLEQLHQNERRALELSDGQARETVARSQWAGLLVFGVSLLVCGGILLLLYRSICRLRGMSADLAFGTEQVAAAASQVSASSQSLAQGSSEQAASLEETSASSEQINSMARKNSENSGAAAKLVTSSQQKFDDTSQSLEQTVVAMGEINAQSGKISKIIKTIDEIAFQTNILALNAAVEAARAGEAGMGFAVVADEVRNLAQRCAQAAKDTASLIEESIAKSNDGKTKVDQVAAAIRAIIEESAKVKTLVEEVNLGSQEQARSTEQIGKAISQMEQVTQKTAANAEESASAAEELNAQSETLKDIVERLTAMVGGETGNGNSSHNRAAGESGAETLARSQAPSQCKTDT